MFPLSRERSTVVRKLSADSLLLRPAPAAELTSLLMVCATILCRDSRELLFTIPRLGPTSIPARRSDWEGGKRGREGDGGKQGDGGREGG